MKLDIKRELKILETKLYPWISRWIFSTNHKDIKNFYLVFGVIAGLFLILGICDPSISNCSFDPCNVANYKGSVTDYKDIPLKVRLVGETLKNAICPGHVKIVYVIADDSSIWEVICTSKEWINDLLLKQYGDKAQEIFVKESYYDAIKLDMPSDIVNQCKDRFEEFKVSVNTQKCEK